MSNFFFYFSIKDHNVIISFNGISGLQFGLEETYILLNQTMDLHKFMWQSNQSQAKYG